MPCPFIDEFYSIINFMHDFPRFPVRKSIRLPAYNYSSSGIYFITVCTRGLLCRFGKIFDWNMDLNVIGRTVQQCWQAIPEHFGFVHLDEFVVMPNHFHGILVIISNEEESETERGTRSTINNLHFSKRLYESGKPPAKSIPSIVGSFKSAATRLINQQGTGMAGSIWHRNYYEHIIRSEAELIRIRNYIVNNPAKWQLDRFNPINNK